MAQWFLEPKAEWNKGKTRDDELMTALTNQHYVAATTCTKHQNKWERQARVDMSASSSQGGLQLSIDVGMEMGRTMDIWKSQSALL